MAGFSAWEIELLHPRLSLLSQRPLAPTKADFAAAFGAGRKSPW
jgi:hypothetical protein